MTWNLHFFPKRDHVSGDQQFKMCASSIEMGIFQPNEISVRSSFQAMALEVQDERGSDWSKNCLLRVGGVEVSVFTSRVRQSEWALSDVLSFLTASQKSKKRLERFNTWIDVIKDYHNRMWPGVDFLLLETKFSACSPREQKFWLGRRTVSTSVLFAMIAYMFNYLGRKHADRACSHRGMVHLLNLLVGSIGAFSIEHVKCGEFGVHAEVFELITDHQGRVCITIFFDRHFWEKHARREWKQDLQDKRKTWVTVFPVFNDHCYISLVDLVAFLLDPHHSESLRDCAVPCALEVLTHLAFVVDSKVEDMCRELTPFQSGTKRKRQLPEAHQAIVAQIANMIWSGEVPCQ